MRYFILFIFMFTVAVRADGKSVFSAKDIQSWKINKKAELYLSYIRFFRSQEKESLFRYIDTNSKTSFLQSFSDYLINNAYAEVYGATCFFGGWKSDVKNEDYCVHPKKLKDRSYSQGGCFNTEFKCNPTLFGNTCVKPRHGYKGLTESCWKKFNDNNLIKPFLANKKWKDFEKIQKDVMHFCDQNKSGKNHYTYDACESLIRHLDNIKNELNPFVKKENEDTTKVTTVKKDSNSSDDLHIVITKTEEIIEMTEEIIYPSKIPCPDKSCEEMANCSESLLDRTKRTYSKGFMGTVLFQDTPQDECADKVDISRINLDKLDNFIHKQDLFESPYSKFSISGKKCLNALNNPRKKKQETLAKTYMLVDFYDKQARLANGSEELLKGLAEVNAMLKKPLSTNNFCNSQMKKVDQQCEALKNCNPSKSTFLDKKVKGAQEALKQVIRLEEDAENLRRLSIQRRNFKNAIKKYKGKYNVSSSLQAKKLRQKILQRIDELEKVYPWIKDQYKDRAKLLASEEKMKKVATEFYKDHKKKLEKMYKDNERAYQCLFDTQSVNYSEDCDDIDLIVKRNPHLNYDNLNGKQGGAFDYYQCAESQRYLNEKQIDTVEDYAIMAGLSVVPFGLGHLGRAAIWGGRLLLAADTAYMGNFAKEEYQSCREKEVSIQQCNSDPLLSCSDFSSSSIRLQNGLGAENCLLEGLTPTALALVPYGGYMISRLGKAATVVSKTKLPTTKVKTGEWIPAKKTSKSRALTRKGKTIEGEVIDVEVVKTAKIKGPSRRPAIEYKKTLALPKQLFSQGEKFAQDEFMRILKKLGIDYRVYLKKNLSPKNRERLISEILRYEKISIRGQGNRAVRKKQRLKSLIKEYGSKLKDAQSEGQRGFNSQWRRLLQGI